jgi:aminopeptidase N
MRFLILILLMTFSAFSQTPTIEPGVSHELAKWRAAHYSDVRYKLDLTLEKMSPLLKGTIEIRVSVGSGSTGSVPPAVAGGSTPVILDWRKIKGFEDRSTISNVSINGRAVQSTGLSRQPPEGGTPNGYDESNEHLIFRDGIVAGENVIKLDFTSPVLSSGSAITRYIDKEDGSEYIYSLFVPSDASTAFPVFDQPDLKAKFSMGLEIPADWNAVSNSAYLVGAAKDLYRDKDRKVSYHFFETKPISTYVFAFAAGPFENVKAEGGNPTGREGASDSRNVKPDLKEAYKKWSNTTVSGLMSKEDADRFRGIGSAETSTSIYVRRSQLAKFQPHAAEVFRLNREGVKFLEQYFDYKFPFPKYDLVLIPEFPFGGMEQAGATFLREDRMIFPQEPTKNDYITRANLIFHEAAHQWFGDTVTMRWFDDLWLKEGFAEFMAYKTLEKVMPEYNVWKVFYERNKQAAYLTDSTKGTTPIYQEIKNLSAAKSAYGNIVYRKAPSFLKQAEFLFGEDKFQTAVRRFLRKHEFGNAEWAELVSEFATASGRDLSYWGAQWVKARGLPIVRIKGNVITQDNAVGDASGWSQQFKVYSFTKNANPIYKDSISIQSVLLDKFSQPTTVPADATFTFLNYEDYGYGIFLLEPKSRDYILKNIQNEKDDFLRSMMWGALWDSVRESELDPKEFVALATRNLPIEKDETITASVLTRLATALTYYIDDAGRAALTRPLEQMLEREMLKQPNLGQRITFYRAYLSIGASIPAREVYKKILRGEFWPKTATMGGLIIGGNKHIPLKTKDRFDIVTRLVILNDPDARGLLAELEKTETSDEAKRYAYAARAGIATAENKAKYWNDFTANKEISESWIEAAFGPFNSVRHADLTLPYLERALKELPNHKRNRKIFFVNGWLAAFIGGQRSDEALAVVNKFLADNPNLDRDLRLKILENVDLIERAVKIRGKFATR